MSFNVSSWVSEEHDELPSTIVSNASINPDEIELNDSDEGRVYAVFIVL